MSDALELVGVFVLIFCICFTSVVGVTWLAIALGLLDRARMWPWQK